MLEIIGGFFYLLIGVAVVKFWIYPTVFKNDFCSDVHWLILLSIIFWPFWFVFWGCYFFFVGLNNIAKWLAWKIVDR